MFPFYYVSWVSFKLFQKDSCFKCFFFQFYYRMFGALPRTGMVLVRIALLLDMLALIPTFRWIPIGKMCRNHASTFDLRLIT